ncbi:alpha-tocopherol transfer protein-like isoform X2 [Dermacentor variabilis]|uniref:alpha-tocopherol transfer protein-like isoform X2 n=1 Tax=Dermacentor variabilis TaxID=34621 RepID=UPI003F5CA1FD
MSGEKILREDQRHRAWLGEDIPVDGVAQDSLAELRRLLEDEPELGAPTDSADLLRFLRLRKYDIGASLEALRKYCAIRASSPNIFEGLKDPEKLRKLTRDYITVLPRRNLHGRPVVFYKLGSWQPSKVSHLQMTQAVVMCIEYASRHPAAQTAGVALVTDFEGWSFGKMRFFDIGVMKDYLHYLQITFHGKHVDQLYADISPSMLFSEYGGTAPNTDWDLFWTSMCQEHSEGKAGRQL